MIKFKEAGYTPNNFQTLVDASGLNNEAFIKKFGLKRASFYFYKNGSVTIPYKDWEKLRVAVEEYLQEN